MTTAIKATVSTQVSAETIAQARDLKERQAARQALGLVEGPSTFRYQVLGDGTIARL